MSDIGLAIELARHIENPCSDPVRGYDFREDYLILAWRVLENFQNPSAKEFLEGIIQDYSKKS